MALYHDFKAHLLSCYISFPINASDICKRITQNYGGYLYKRFS